MAVQDLKAQQLAVPTAIAQYDQVDSTNRVALDRIQSGERGPLWVVARSQTSGRGRLGRDWQSEEGNLFASLIWAPGPLAANLQVLPFAVGLAIRKSLLLCGLADNQASLKWPNDVLVDGAKICGCLIERAPQAIGQNLGPREPGLVPLVIGIGINVTHAPPSGTQMAATSLHASLGPGAEKPDAQSVLAALARSFETVCADWQMLGAASVMNSWRAAAWGMGREQQIRTRDETFKATLVRVEDDGGLVLIRSDNKADHQAAPEILYAGDVFPAGTLDTGG